MKNEEWRMERVRFVVVCLSLLVVLAACSVSSGDATPTALLPSPTIAPTARPPTLIPTSWPTNTPLPPSPTPEPTFTPIPEGPFSRTQARYIDYANQPSSEELRRLLGETFVTDTLTYLDAVINPDVPLDEQRDVLAQMASDLPLPGWDDGEVIVVNVDSAVATELVVCARMGGVPLLYAYYTAGRWQITPVPWPDKIEVAQNLWPDAVEAQDLTGDGLPELVATYRLRGGSGGWDYVQVFRWTGADFALLFRADLLTWAGESRYTLEPDPTQPGVMQIVLTYPHLYNLGFDHKMVNHPLGWQVWHWDAGAGRFVFAESGVDLEHSVWGADAEVTVEDRLRWLVNEGETRFRQGDYAAALPWYDQALALAEAEAWEPAKKEPHWPAFAAFRRAQLLLSMGQVAEGRPAMQAVAIAWEGDRLGALARAYLEGYGAGGADAAARAIEAMRAAVNLEMHFYYEGSGLLRYPMNAGGILFSGVASLPPAPEWPRVGTFD